MYNETDLVRIAKRENNNKRNYLVVNRLQGKHIPVKPVIALGMFRELAATIKGSYKGETLLLVGFAETATAIGAAVAIELGTKYIQTTREVIPGVEYIFFSEEHSHATEQKLVKDDLDACMEGIDRIVFVEDEVTTGKTILNIIEMLEKQYPDGAKFSVASLLNGMDDVALQLYADKEIPLHYLVKTRHDAYSVVAEQFAGDGVYVECNTSVPQMEDATDKAMEFCEKQELAEGHGILGPQVLDGVTEYHIKGAVNARRLVDANLYQEACGRLWGQIETVLDKELEGRVLVLGTEEFMYPSLYVAEQLQQKGVEVWNHATTRSPIAVSSEPEYPLHERYELRSLYDKDRVTFVYDIAAYDTVLVVTDAPKEQKEGLNSLVNALKRKNKKIFCIRWY